jgi:hypothetical protein
MPSFKEAVKSFVLMRVFCLHFLFQTIDNLIKIPICVSTDSNFN